MRHVARHAINSLLANGFNGSYTVLVYEQDGLYSAVNPFGDVLFSGTDVVEVEEFVPVPEKIVPPIYLDESPIK